MKLAVLSESEADEAAIWILAQAVLGRGAEQVATPHVRTRGWPAVKLLLPSLLKHLHYRTDADGLVIVVDSDYTPVHTRDHDQPGGADNNCRLCQLRGTADEVTQHLSPVSGRALMKIALGVAVPCIEAWYCCGIDHRVGEAGWHSVLQSQTKPYTPLSLKEAIYGNDRPPLELAKRRASEEAQRLVEDVGKLDQAFPGGFGSLSSSLRSWLGPMP